MLNYLLFYGFLYSLLCIIFPSKESEVIIDIEIEGDFEDLEIDIEE